MKNKFKIISGINSTTHSTTKTGDFHFKGINLFKLI